MTIRVGPPRRLVVVTSTRGDRDGAGRFKPGIVPFNKGTKGLMKANAGTFKPENIPVNYRPVGSERVTVDGYTEIKVAEPRTWKLKHRVLWQEKHGPIPRGHKLIFGDGDKANFALDNLILVTNAEMAVLNKLGLIQNDANLTRAGVLIADIKMSVTRRKRNGK